MQRRGAPRRDGLVDAPPGRGGPAGWLDARRGIVLSPAPRMSAPRSEPGNGRGAAAILLAKIVFMVTGYGLVAGLTRALGPEGFGVYSVVFGVVALVNMVVIQGGLQASSHFVARNPERVTNVRFESLKYQAVLGLGVVLALELSAPLIAGMLGDPALSPLLRWSGLITAFYAIYAVNVGCLNGARRFVTQASLDITFALVKVATILVIAFAGFGVPGVIGAFTFSAALIVVVSFAVMEWPRRTESSPVVSVSTFVGFVVAAMSVAFLFNCLLQADLFMLKRALNDDGAAGIYAAAQHVSRIPYYLLTAAALVIFPNVAKAGEVASDARAELVSRAFTGLAGILAGMAAATIPIAPRVVRVLYPPSFDPAAAPLAWLIAGLVLLTLTFLTLSMISASGFPRVSARILGIALVCQLICTSYLIPQKGMVGAAMGTTAAGVVGLLQATLWAHARLGLGVRGRAVVSVLAASIVTAGVVAVFDALAPNPGHPLLTVLAVAFAFGVHVVSLLLLGVLCGLPAEAKRVLLVTKPLGRPWNDGSKTVAKTLAAALPPERVTLFVEPGEKLEDLDPRIERLRLRGASLSGARLGANLRLFFAVLLHRHRFQVVHFMFAPNRPACRAIRYLRWISPGVVFGQTVMSRPRNDDEPAGLKFGHFIVAHSEATARRLGTEVEVLRPPVSVPPQVRPRGEALERLCLDPTQTQLLFAGDVDHGGGLENLGRMLPTLMASEPRLTLHLSVRTKTGDSLARARRFAEALPPDIARRVVQHVDYQPFEFLLDAADALVLPLEDLTGKVDAPLVGLESFARGKPVFALERSPIDEMFAKHDRARWLAATPEELVERIRQWLPNRDIIPELAEHAHQRFSPEKYARRLQALYGWR